MSHLAADLVDLRRRLAELRRRHLAGERSAIFPAAQRLADEVICLLDEAPGESHPVIHRLADRCEALLRSIAH
ncbi:hypothetical protein [Microcystis phage Mwe-Yong1]|nr:hypothetical protein [Microcystis phage Mwe-Yong1]